VEEGKGRRGKGSKGKTTTPPVVNSWLRHTASYTQYDRLSYRQLCFLLDFSAQNGWWKIVIVHRPTLLSPNSISNQQRSKLLLLVVTLTAPKSRRRSPHGGVDARRYIYSDQPLGNFSTIFDSRKMYRQGWAKPLMTRTLFGLNAQI